MPIKHFRLFRVGGIASQLSVREAINEPKARN